MVRKQRVMKKRQSAKREQQKRQEAELSRFANDDSSENEQDDKEEEPTTTKKNLLQQQKKQQHQKQADDSNKEASRSSEEDASSSKDDDSSEDDSDDFDDDKQPKQKSALFSDENAKWLKPKNDPKASKGLLDDEDNDEDGEDSENDDDEDNDHDELLQIERDAQLVDEEMEIEKAEAEEELRRTVREHTSMYRLPSRDEVVAANSDRVVPPSELRQHVESILEVLADFKPRREPGRARKEYIDMLGYFLAELYGYLPELVEYFLTMFGPTETLEFLEASDKPRPMVIRTNTLKARRKDLAAALIKRGVSLDPLASWSKVGLKIIESPVPMGATPEYLGGFYMLQSAASMCPVLALSPVPNERVLDMSAAPGGKTSYIAQLMKNTGVVIANDLKAARQKATVANMHRLGVKSVIACMHDGRKMGHMFKNRFDRVLLDAPCSGLGVISRDPSVKVQRTVEDVKQCAHLQKELLLAAIDSLKCKNTTGGVMVYSTCSVSIHENEEVVQYALSKRDIKLVDTGLDFGTPGYTRYQEKRFHPSLALTRRFYPHVHNMDGFFVAKIQKMSDKIPGANVEPSDPVDEEISTPAEPTKKKVGDNMTKAETGKKLKHKTKSTDNTTSDPPPTKAAKVSVPPTAKISDKGTKRKSRNNAKMTQPRRKKASADI